MRVEARHGAVPRGGGGAGEAEFWVYQSRTIVLETAGTSARDCSSKRIKLPKNGLGIHWQPSRLW